jgi:endonuclease/exonuclease/phosphatase family metal-dependent hydrolase
MSMAFYVARWCPQMRSMRRARGIPAFLLMLPGVLLLLLLTERVNAEPVSFTVLTYNIRAGLGSAGPDRKPQEARDKQVDLAPIVAAIKSTNADVVALQEVVGDAQARYIAATLGMSYVYARHGATYGHWWGVAILSKFPIVRHRSLPISHGRGNTRSDLLVEIRVGASNVTVVNVHVDKDLKDGSPIRRTIANLAAVKGPVIVLGDFNARPNARRLAPMRERFTDAVDSETADGAKEVRRLPTFTRDGQPVAGARIDHIFVDPRFLDVRAVGLIDRAHWPASDHIGMTARVAVKARP